MDHVGRCDGHAELDLAHLFAGLLGRLGERRCHAKCQTAKHESDGPSKTWPTGNLRHAPIRHKSASLTYSRSDWCIQGARRRSTKRSSPVRLMPRIPRVTIGTNIASVR